MFSFKLYRDKNIALNPAAITKCAATFADLHSIIDKLTAASDPALKEWKEKNPTWVDEIRLGKWNDVMKDSLLLFKKTAQVTFEKEKK